MNDVWYQLSKADMKSSPEYGIEAYDQLCEFLGSRPFGLRKPKTLVERGHVVLFVKDGKIRAELDQKLVRELCGAGDPSFITSSSTVQKTVGGDIRWLGKDPKGVYPKCQGWYGREVKGKMRARAMVELPLHRVNKGSSSGDLPERLTLSEAQIKRIKRAAMRW